MDQIRIGKISSLNYKDGTARVVYSDRDDAVTAELPLLSSEYYMPAVDDLVLVLHMPNGAEAGVIIGGIWNDNNRPTENGKGLYRKDLSHDGKAYIKYDDTTGRMTIHCTGGIDIDSDVTVNGVSVATHTHTGYAGVTTSGPK